MSAVLEVVTFRTSVDAQAFLATVPASTRFLRACPGFVGRRLARSADGEWVDCVEWQSMEQALAAAPAFSENALTQAFNAAIAPGSAHMRHFIIAEGQSGEAL